MATAHGGGSYFTPFFSRARPPRPPRCARARRRSARGARRSARRRPPAATRRRAARAAARRRAERGCRRPGWRDAAGSLLSFGGVFGSRAKAALCHLRRWASPHECGGQPQAFRYSPTSPWRPATAPPGRHFGRAAEADEPTSKAERAAPELATGTALEKSDERHLRCMKCDVRKRGVGTRAVLASSGRREPDDALPNGPCFEGGHRPEGPLVFVTWERHARVTAVQKAETGWLSST